MNTEAFKLAYGMSRNGANDFFRHSLVKHFHYSDGVQQCAEAGVYWLLDVVATEFLKPLRTSGESMGILEVLVVDGGAKIELTISEDTPPVYRKRIALTDMPDGKWAFYLADEGERFALILPTEY